ncbi:MAG: hypothetical protein AAB658_02545 [Chloroflexota bacterium]
MKKKLQPKRTLPALSLRLQIKRGCLTLQLSVRARWLAATLIIVTALLMGSDALPRLLELLPRLLG